MTSQRNVIASGQPVVYFHNMAFFLMEAQKVPLARRHPDVNSTSSVVGKLSLTSIQPVPSFGEIKY